MFRLRAHAFGTVLSGALVAAPLSGCHDLSRMAESTRTRTERLQANSKFASEVKEAEIEEQADPNTLQAAVLLEENYYSAQEEDGTWSVRNVETGEVVSDKKEAAKNLSHEEADRLTEKLRSDDTNPG